jgi:hypothetical protein
MMAGARSFCFVVVSASLAACSPIGRYSTPTLSSDAYTDGCRHVYHSDCSCPQQSAAMHGSWTRIEHAVHFAATSSELDAAAQETVVSMAASIHRRRVFFHLRVVAGGDDPGSVEGDLASQRGHAVEQGLVAAGVVADAFAPPVIEIDSPRADVEPGTARVWMFEYSR